MTWYWWRKSFATVYTWICSRLEGRDICWVSWLWHNRLFYGLNAKCVKTCVKCVESSIYPHFLFPAPFTFFVQISVSNLYFAKGVRKDNNRIPSFQITMAPIKKTKISVVARATHIMLRCATGQSYVISKNIKIITGCCRKTVGCYLTSFRFITAGMIAWCVGIKNFTCVL